MNKEEKHAEEPLLQPSINYGDDDAFSEHHGGQDETQVTVVSSEFL